MLSCDLRLRPAKGPEVAAMVEHRLAAPALAKPNLWSPPPIVPVNFTLHEAHAIIAEGGDMVLANIVSRPQVRIANWSTERSSLFWWQACQDALAPDTIWSIPLDCFAVTRGWPSVKLMAALTRGDGAKYNLAPPKKILLALAPWLSSLAEEEILHIVAQPAQMLISALASHTTVLTRPVLTALSANAKNLLSLTKRNPHLTPEAALICWDIIRHKSEEEGSRVTPSPAIGQRLRPTGSVSPQEVQRAAILSSAEHLVNRAFLPNSELQDEFWDLAVERVPTSIEADASAPLLTGLATGFAWRAHLARTILLNPALQLSSRELDALWTASPNWRTTEQLAWHPNLSAACALRMCAAFRQSHWRSYSLNPRLGRGICEGFAQQPWFHSTMPVEEYVLAKAVPLEFSLILRHFPGPMHNAVVKGWLDRTPFETLQWLTLTRSSERAFLSPTVLSGVLANNENRPLRAAALQALGLLRPSLSP